MVFDLFADLEVDGIVTQIFQFDVHGRFFQVLGITHKWSAHVTDAPGNHSVLVTFDNERGESGFSPFASANNAANSWPGTIYGIGATNSSISFGITIERVHNFAASRSPVIARVSACSSRRRSIRFLTPGNITPGGANKITGKCLSTI